MTTSNGNLGWIVSVLFCGMAANSAALEIGRWDAGEKDGRLEARLGGKLMFAWQSQPLAKPAGGEKFAGSAFLHPLRTPAGFEWTAIQPKDHLHHFGLWWPWKYIEVDGAKYNCWEIQEGQGARQCKRHLRAMGGGER